ncbi:hypothetical protein HaLaN_22171 [Haematococcus lacustris]|uniref:Uncharacterized protein n=1 Tax=Haematococcus lacustris TaxID=44745 RepID=A0A699ZNX6_HAELA|nr:hypothetical protein HaLaN_22171 [Haematococcus lacustris]
MPCSPPPANRQRQHIRLGPQQLDVCPDHQPATGSHRHPVLWELVLAGKMGSLYPTMVRGRPKSSLASSGWRPAGFGDVVRGL